MDFVMHVVGLLHPAESFTLTLKSIIPFLFLSLWIYRQPFVLKVLHIRHILSVSKLFIVWCLRCYCFLLQGKPPPPPAFIMVHCFTVLSLILCNSVLRHLLPLSILPICVPCCPILSLFALIAKKWEILSLKSTQSKKKETHFHDKCF